VTPSAPAMASITCGVKFRSKSNAPSMPVVIGDELRDVAAADIAKRRGERLHRDVAADRREHRHGAGRRRLRRWLAVGRAVSVRRLHLCLPEPADST